MSAHDWFPRSHHPAPRFRVLSDKLVTVWWDGAVWRDTRMHPAAFDRWQLSPNDAQCLQSWLNYTRVKELYDTAWNHHREKRAAWPRLLHPLYDLLIAEPDMHEPSVPWDHLRANVIAAAIIHHE